MTGVPLAHFFSARSWFQGFVRFSFARKRKKVVSAHIAHFARFAYPYGEVERPAVAVGAFRARKSAKRWFRFAPRMAVGACLPSFLPSPLPSFPPGFLPFFPLSFFFPSFLPGVLPSFRQDIFDPETSG